MVKRYSILILQNTNGGLFKIKIKKVISQRVYSNNSKHLKIYNNFSSFLYLLYYFSFLSK